MRGHRIIITERRLLAERRDRRIQNTFCTNFDINERGEG
jgi:hypothetical protein